MVEVINSNFKTGKEKETNQRKCNAQKLKTPEHILWFYDFSLKYHKIHVHLPPSPLGCPVLPDIHQISNVSHSNLKKDLVSSIFQVFL